MTDVELALSQTCWPIGREDTINIKVEMKQGHEEGTIKVKKNILYGL